MAGRSFLEEKISRRILERLEQERFRPGARLPPERELAGRFDTSRYIVRAALRLLEARGILDRRPQSGYYLVRLPDAPLTFAGQDGTRLVSLMLMEPSQQVAVRDLQRSLMRRGVMLHTYFSIMHGGSPQEEREYLLHAAASGAAAVLIHATPTPPTNDELFRELARRLRLIHIGMHGLELPEQSCFVPDYRLAGAMAAGRLCAAGCRTVRVLSVLPAEHHVSQLLSAGASGVPGGKPLSLLAPLYGESPLRPEAERLLARLGPRDGLIVYGTPVARVLTEVLGRRRLSPAHRPPVVCIVDDPEDSPYPGGQVLAFSWRNRVADAVAFALDGRGDCRRLYAPSWGPAP
jgi:hypothetical protein